MEDPAREIPELVNVLLTGSGSERRAAIDKNFAPDATFDHPFFVVNTAEEIFWIYHAWSWMNRHNVTFDAETSALSAAGDLVTIAGWTHVNPFFWSPFLPVFHVKIISLVYLAKNEEGRKVITKQHDSHIWLGSIAHNIPGFQWVYEVLWRQVFGAVAVFLMQLLFGFLKLFKLAKYVDTPPVSLMGMARALLGIKNEPVVNQDDYNSEGSGHQGSGSSCSTSHLTTVSEEGPAGEKEEPSTEQGEPSILEEATNDIPTLSSDDSDDSDPASGYAIHSEPSSVQINPKETLQDDDTEAEAGIVNANEDGSHSIPPSSTPDAPHPAAVPSEALHAQQVNPEVPQTELSSSSEHSSEDSFKPAQNAVYDTRTASTELSEPHGSPPVTGPQGDYPSLPRSALETNSPPSLPSPPTSSSHASSPEPMSYSEAAIAQIDMGGLSPDTMPPTGNQAAETQHNGPRGSLDGESSAAAAVAPTTKALGSTPRSGPLAVDEFPTLECSMTGVQGPGRSTDTGGCAKGAECVKGVDRVKGADPGSATSDGTDPSSAPSPKAPGGGRKPEQQSKIDKNRKVNNKKKKKSSNSGSN